MAAPKFNFPDPKSEGAVCKAVMRVVAAGQPRLNVKSVTWQIVQHYLNGVRNFREINYRDGSVQITHVDSKGRIPFKYEDVLRQYQTEVGRLMRVDISPVVEKKGEGLDAVRRASVAQLALNEAMPSAKSDMLKVQAIPPYTRYGTLGLQAWPRYDEEEKRTIPEIEVVMPWEIIPVPAAASSISEVYGLCRTRWVSLDWLESHETLKKGVKANMDQLEVRSLPYGQNPTGGEIGNYANPQDASLRSALAVPPKDIFDKVDPATSKEHKERKEHNEDDVQEFVKLTEVWLLSDDKLHVYRYVAATATCVLFDETYNGGKQPVCPLWIARYADAGGFYGRGYVEPLVPINVEAEQALQNLFENLQEYDDFGMLCVPTSLGVHRQDLKNTGRPKVLFYEQDYAFPEARPFSLQPTNSGTLPVQVANIGSMLMDRVGGQSDLFAGQAPGRVESARALGALFEAASVPLTGPTASLAAAFSGIYMAMLDMVRDEWKQVDISALTLTDDSIVGVVLNLAKGKIELDKTPIPRPTDVSIVIQSRMPVSIEQRKAEMQNALATQVMTPFEYRLAVRKEGLDLPVGNQQEWENYRKAIFNIVLLFGDGKTPGQALLSENDLADVHLYAFQSFMAKPEFMLASLSVRQKFEQALEFYKGLKGGYPEQLPYPEDMGMKPPAAGMPGAMDDTQGALPPPGPGGPAGQAALQVPAGFNGGASLPASVQALLGKFAEGGPH